MTKTLIALFMALFLFQNPTSVPDAMSCMGRVSSPVLKFSGLPRTPIADETMLALQQMPGIDIWIGYPVGYIVPDDIRRAFTISGTGEAGQVVKIWGWAAESLPDTYIVLPFRSMEKSADQNGDYYGVHPCGIFAIDGSDFEDILSGEG